MKLKIIQNLHSVHLILSTTVFTSLSLSLSSVANRHACFTERSRSQRASDQSVQTETRVLYHVRSCFELFSESGRPLQQRLDSRTIARREWLSGDEGWDCTRARVRADLFAARSRYSWRERGQLAEEDAARRQRDRSQVGHSIADQTRAWNRAVSSGDTMERPFHKRVMVALVYSARFPVTLGQQVFLCCQRTTSIFLSFRAHRYACIYRVERKDSAWLS